MQLMTDLSLSPRDLPSLLAYYDNDFYYYTQSLASSHKPLVIHFVNRLLYPLYHISEYSEIATFMNQEVEHPESTPFMAGHYTPMGELYERMTTKNRAVIFSEHPWTYHKFMKIGRRMAHRVDLRLAVVDNRTDISSKFREEFGQDNFRVEDAAWTITECLITKNRFNKTISFVGEGRMLDQQGFINKHSMLPIDILDEHTSHAINTLEIPMYISFMDPDHSLEDEAGQMQLYYVAETHKKLFEVFFNELVFIAMDWNTTHRERALLGIDFEKLPTIAMLYKNGEYAVYPQDKMIDPKSVQWWVRGVQKRD